MVKFFDVKNFLTIWLIFLGMELIRQIKWIPAYVGIHSFQKIILV